MSRKANPTAIGAFVVGGLVLAIGGLIAFGGGKFFKDTTTYVMYFESSVSGLRVGAPVEFRGVQVGEVRDIRGTISEDLEIQIPVYVEIGEGRLQPKRANAAPIRREQAIPVLIKRGMRAQLALQSLVTGQFYIELDFHPDQPPRFVGDGTVPEIPTVPSALSKLRERFEALPLDELAHEAIAALQGINGLVSSEELGNAIDSASEALRQIRQLADQLGQDLPPMVASAQQAFSIAAEDSPVRYQLESSLSELSAAARAIRSFAEYLERHPEALLTGKRGGK
jgi:paraquat-inducible protein B